MLNWRREPATANALAKTIVTFPLDAKLWALRKKIVPARFWHAAMAAWEVPCGASSKTLDPTQKARLKEFKALVMQRRLTPEKELRLPIHELGSSSRAKEAAMLAGAFSGIHAGTK